MNFKELIEMQGDELPFFVGDSALDVFDFSGYVQVLGEGYGKEDG